MVWVYIWCILYIYLVCVCIYMVCVYIYIYIYIYIPHSSVNRLLGCCYVLAIVNGIVRIILMQFLCVLL